MKSEKEIVFLSIQDFFSFDILKFAILPFIITAFIVYTLFFFVSSIGLTNLDTMMLENSNDNTIFAFFVTSTIVTSIIHMLFYTIGSFSMVYVSLFISLFIIGFLTPYILKTIQKKHYSNIIFQGNSSLIEPIIEIIKNIIIVFILLVMLIPFYFIPIINIIAINLPFYFLFHKMLNYDISSILIAKNEREIFKVQHKRELRLRTLLLYLLSMIPFMAIILPVFYIVYIGHGYLNIINFKGQQ